MIFATLDFFLFFGAVFALNWYLKKWPLVWRIFLLLVSYVFYGVWGWNFVGLLVLISFFNWLMALYIERREKHARAFLTVAVIADLGILAYFKYYDFFRTAFEQGLLRFGLKPSFAVLYIALPIGLSFYIFRAISYCVDVYRKKYNAEKSFIDFAIYMAFFPQLLSGPIARAGEFLPQLKNGGAKEIKDVYGNIFHILLGLFKKLVISSWLTILVIDNVFAVPANYGAAEALLAIFGFTLAIYCDFSGYSEIAVGIAGLLGFESPINFDMPYLSKNLQEFWRKWHMTLSGWFRDYLYIPLGGNRVPEWQYYFNLFIVMAVSGLWHGAGWPFIIWGVAHGIGIVFYALIHKNKKASFTGPYASWILNMLFVSLAWIFFRAQDFKTALEMFGALVRFKNSVDASVLPASGYIALGALLVFIEPRLKGGFVDLQSHAKWWLKPIIIILILVLIIELSPALIPPFIYFSF